MNSRSMFPVAAILLLGTTLAAGEQAADLVAALRKLDSRVIVLGTVRQPPLASMLARCPGRFACRQPSRSPNLGADPQPG